MDFTKGLNLFDSLSMSAIGFGVVFLVLVSLAGFVLISSKVFSVIAGSTKKEEVKKVSNEAKIQPVVVKNDKNSKIIAAVISAIAEETGDSVESFQVVDIKKI